MREAHNSKLKTQNSKFKIYTTMSQNSKIKRERYAKKQEKEGKKVVEYIVWGLIILGIAFAVWTFTQA